MNLSYMKAGKANNFIEIASSNSISSYSLSNNKSIVVEESSATSSVNKCDKIPITPIKLMMTPLKKGGFDVSSLFAKKASNIEVISSEEKTKGKQLVGEKFDDISMELSLIQNFTQGQIEKTHEAILDKELEIFEQKAYFVKQMKDLQERNQMLLRENIMLKEIQYELDKSAEKITVFRSGQKNLSICSYLYDSWMNRESKTDLYKKYMEKNQQYDDLLKKYQDLESKYYDALSNKLPKQPNLGSSLNNTNQNEQIKKKRGRKPKNTNLDNSLTDFENENNGPKLTKKVLKSIENQGNTNMSQMNTFFNKKNQQYPNQYIIDDNKSELSVNILKEKKVFNNQQNQRNVSVTPTKAISKIPTKVISVTPTKTQINKNDKQNNRTPIKTTPIKTTLFKTQVNKTDKSNNRMNQQIKEQILLDSGKSSTQRSDSFKTYSQQECNKAPNKNNSKANEQANDKTKKSNNLFSYMQVEDLENDDFDDNKSTISTITNNGGCLKREQRKKKIITKEKKKYMKEQQDTAFNSIADTLFYF